MSNEYVILTDKQNLIDIADLVRHKAGVTGEMTLTGIYNTINKYWLDPTDCLIFSSSETFSISVSSPGWDGTMEYSTNAKTWNTWDGSEISGIKIYIRGTGNSRVGGSSTTYKWTLTGSNITCSGNIENLLDYKTVKAGSHPVMSDYCYGYMFSGCTSLTTAPELPATTLADYCYRNMFERCTSLTIAPALPATTLASSCYQSMFENCTSLAQAPELPATTLADYCYFNMFYKCTSLAQAPMLPATTLVNSCYSFMFEGCTSLATAPELPATTLADRCYYGMFSGCISLTQAPELLATTLADYCYFNMFQNCTKLTIAPELSATTLANYCYAYMFDNCRSLTTTPELPATTLANYCYQSMFQSCISLTQAPTLPATTLANYCYQYMFSGCTSLIQAPELPATTLANYCYQYMFSGCTSLITVPELPATTLANNCYAYTFRGCTSLTQAPELPATTLANNCYAYMFQNCTKLAIAPTLPATTLANYCYQYMFSGCTSLTTAPALPATTLTSYCYFNMFSGCTSLTTAPALPATTLTSYCYFNMFYNCTSLTQVPELLATNLASNCYNCMFYNCTSLKLSATQTDEYTQEYRIPKSGIGTTATNALYYMFLRTGGTFSNTPEINTTYYLHKDCQIVPAPPSWSWGEDGAEADAEWFAGLKEYLQTNNGASLTTSDGSPILGTTKSVTLTTAVLGTTTHLIRVIGVDQDANNTVTWQTANMLSTTTTFGSSAVWIGSTARTLCQNYYNYFPGKASIKTVSKGTCANYNNSRAGTVTYNDETVWLPSEREMGLDSYSPISTANSTTTNAECTYGKNFSYTYYSSNTNRVKKQGDSGSAYYYWERSRYYGSVDTYTVCLVGSGGSASSSFYDTSRGLAPAFVIGN